MGVQGREYGAVTIMSFWIMEGYAVGFLIGSSVVVSRSILRGDEVEG